MRPLTARLEVSYCSIIITNHQLITVIRFISKSYTHPWKGYANSLHLVLHANEIFFSKNVRDNNQTRPWFLSGLLAPCMCLNRGSIDPYRQLRWISFVALFISEYKSLFPIYYGEMISNDTRILHLLIHKLRIIMSTADGLVMGSADFF